MIYDFFLKNSIKIRSIIVILLLITISFNIFLRNKIVKKYEKEYTAFSIEVMRDETKHKNSSLDVTNYFVSEINDTRIINNNLVIPPKYFRNYSKLLPFEFYSIDNRKESQLLPRGLSLNEYDKLMDLIEILAKILSENNMEYLIGYGTQLGSRRHWDLIPWDDDFDIVTEYSGFDRLKSYLTDQKEWENLSFHRFGDIIKIFFKDGTSISGANWKFPYIDIFFFDVNKTSSLYCVAPRLKICRKANDMFPLKLRPLGKFWVPAPRIDEVYLYNNALTDCYKSGADHRHQVKITNSTIYKCDIFKSDYPFVEKTCNITHCIEKLKLNDKIIGSILFEKQFF